MRTYPFLVKCPPLKAPVWRVDNLHRQGESLIALAREIDLSLFRNPIMIYDLPYRGRNLEAWGRILRIGERARLLRCPRPWALTDLGRIALDVIETPEAGC